MTIQDTRGVWDVDTRGLADWDVDAWDFEDWDFDDEELRVPGEDFLGPEVVVPAPGAMAALPLAERTRIIDAYVRRELARVLRVPPQDIRVTGRTMNGLGVGSVAGLQLQNRIESALDVQVNLQMLLLANSAQELIDCLAGQLGPEGARHDHHHPGQRG